MNTYCKSKRLLGYAIALFFILPINIFADENKDAPPRALVAKGSLFLVGGNASDDPTLKAFVDYAGGQNAYIAIIPHADSNPARISKDLETAFQALGAKTIVVAPADNTLPPNITAIYFTGGVQTRLTGLITQQMLDEISKFYVNGGLVGGSSAGAMALVDRMIAGGMSDGTITYSSLRLADGFKLLPGAVVDTHVSQMCRMDRLKVALALIGDVVGIGLDEDTALYIHNGKAKVHGTGYLRLYQRGKGFRHTLDPAKPDAPASVFNVVESTIASGEEFDWPLPKQQ